MAGITTMNTSDYQKLLNELNGLKRVSEFQSTRLAQALREKNDALKEKNDAIKRALNFEQIANELERRARIAEQRLAAYDIPPVPPPPQPKFRVGQIVRVESDGQFFGYHKIIAWRYHSISDLDPIVYDFEPTKHQSPNWLDGTGEQYLAALEKGDYNG